MDNSFKFETLAAKVMYGKHEINYEQHASIASLSANERDLFHEALQAMQQAYAPYSNFKVGAAILLDDGTMIRGNNQENIAFPSGICAERVALFQAGANHQNKEVLAMVVVADGTLNGLSNIVSPCGACRQVMLESEGRQKKTIRVILVGYSGEVIVFHSAKDLLPFAFGF